MRDAPRFATSGASSWSTRRRATVGAFALLVLAATPGACAGPAHVGMRPPPVIAVTGRGEVTARPDVALVQLGVETRRPTLADATADVGQRMAMVLERVRAAGVRAEDVTTVRYVIEPLTARRPDPDDVVRVVGYRATNIVQLKVRDVAAVGRVVDAAVAAGANVLHGVRFTLDDRAAAEAAARERAVAAARVTAEQLAAAAGVRLGRLVSLTEGTPIRPFADAPRVMAIEARGPGPVEPGELAVVVTVDARYRIQRE